MTWAVHGTEGLGRYSRGRFTPSSESAAITANAASVIPTTSHGRRLRRNASQPPFAQSTPTPAAAPAQTTITGASTAARESEISNTQTTASTSAAVTNPDAIAALVLMGCSLGPGLSST